MTLATLADLLSRHGLLLVVYPDSSIMVGHAETGEYRTFTDVEEATAALANVAWTGILPSSGVLEGPLPALDWR